jgi:hypothetical protein
MAITKQTAKRSTGGKAPRAALAILAARKLRVTRGPDVGGDEMVINDTPDESSTCMITTYMNRREELQPYHSSSKKICNVCFLYFSFDFVLDRVERVFVGRSMYIMLQRLFDRTGSLRYSNLLCHPTTQCDEKY